MAQRVGRGIALLFHDRSFRSGCVVSSTPQPQFTPGKDPVPILQEAGGPQSRSGWAENLVPTGIRFRTVQPVVSRYTDGATRPTNAKSHTHYNAKDERVFTVFSSAMLDDTVVLCFCNCTGYMSHLGTSESTL